MKPHLKAPYRRPLSPAWRPAMASLDAALAEFAARRSQEQQRWLYLQYHGSAVAKPRPDKPTAGS